MPEHSIWVKVGLYTFDVGSDWVNGGLMLDCSSNATLNETIPIFNTTLSKDDGCEPWWGSMTIAMSWSPPTILFFIGIVVWIAEKIKKGGCSSLVDLCLWTCLGPIIYVLWPLLVPIGM